MQFRCESIIDTVFLHVTKACNMSCSYCYWDTGSAHPEELDKAEMCYLLSDVADLNPRRLVFTGGEPLLRGDIEEIITLCKSDDSLVNTKKCLNTNGRLVDRTTAKYLVRLCDEVRISVDGFPEQNDRLRGAGSFQAAMKAIDSLRDLGGQPAVSITVSKINMDSLSEFVPFLLFEKGISRIRLNPLRPSRRDTKAENLLPVFDDVERILADIRRDFFGLSASMYNDHTSNDKGINNCGVGRYINIFSDGSIYPCHLLRIPDLCLGNVRTHSLIDVVYESNLLGKLRNLSFAALATRDDRLSILNRPGICLGEHIQEHNVSILLEWL